MDLLSISLAILAILIGLLCIRFQKRDNRKAEIRHWSAEVMSEIRTMETLFSGHENGGEKSLQAACERIAESIDQLQKCTGRSFDAKIFIQFNARDPGTFTPFADKVQEYIHGL